MGGADGGDVLVGGSLTSNGNIEFASNQRRFIFDGGSGSTQTVEVPDDGANANDNFPAVIIESGPTVNLAADARIEGDFTNQVGGTFNASGFSINFNGSTEQIIDVDAPNTTFANVTVSNDTDGEFQSDTDIGGDLTIATASVFSLNDTEQPNLDVGGTFSVQGTFNGTSGSTITLFGDFSNADMSTFNSNGTQLIFAGNTDQIVSGGSNLTEITVDNVIVEGAGTVVDLDLELNVENDLLITDEATVTLNNDGDPLDINSDLTIDPNSSLSLSPSDGGDLSVAGNFENRGTLNTQGRIVTFDGTTAQDIIGSFTGTSGFETLEIDNSSASSVELTNFGTTVEVGVVRSNSFIGELRLTQGTLSVPFGTFLTMNSPSETEAAVINQLGNGTVSGNLTIERTIGTASLSQGQFRMIASSVEGMVLDDAGASNNSVNWLSNIYTQSTGTGGNTENVRTEAATVYTYDEGLDLDGNPSTSPPNGTDAEIDDAQADGWTPIADLDAESVTRGTGYLVFIFENNNQGGAGGPEDFPVTLAGSGTIADNENQLNTSAISIPASCTENDGGCASDFDGWNLVGNPYQGYIDWLDPNVSFTNIDPTYWVWDADNSSYEIFQDDGTSSGSGVGTDGDQFISPSQAFFIKANSGGGQLRISSAAKTNPVSGGDREFKSAPDESVTKEEFFLQAKNADTDRVEGTVIKFISDGANAGKDPLDAHQLYPLAAGADYAVLSSRISGYDGATFDIQSQPYPSDSVTVDLYFEGTAGTYTFSGPNPNELPEGWGAFITDKQTDNRYDLYRGETVTFDVTATTASKRLANIDPTAPPEQRNIRGMLSNPVLRVGGDASKSSGSFSDRFTLTLIPPSVLPVEFGSFTGSADGEGAAVLEWTTLSESNNSGFYVEQMKNGSFQTVSSLIRGAGTSTEQQSYDFRVEELDRGTTHTFRIRQVDVDGGRSFSEEIDISVGIGGAYKLEAYPNPVTTRETPTVRFAVDQSQPVTVEVYNTLGQRVRTLYDGTPTTTGQFVPLQLDTSALSSGIYFIRMRGDSFTTTEKLVVVR